MMNSKEVIPQITCRIVNPLTIALAALAFCFGCSSEWELVPVEPLPLDECRDFGSDQLVIKQDAQLFMFGYTTSNIRPLLDYDDVRRRLKGTGDQPQLTIKVAYDSLENRSRVQVRAFPGEESMTTYLDNLAATWQRSLRYTSFIRNVEFIILIFPERLELRYTKLSTDIASNPRRKCYTIPMRPGDAKYLVPLDYSAGQISIPLDRMKDDVRQQLLAYQQRRRVFTDQFQGRRQ